ncbi:MAG: antitoxin, family [Nevskia sp.]|nr:antitoxin, family [Nevskia sp.]
MKEIDILRRQQLEDVLKPFLATVDTPVPKDGWIAAIRQALGLSNVQLARRLNRKASQTVDDLLESEAAGTIKLNTLRELAAALDCRLVYAIVPNKPFDEIRREQALKIANNLLGPASHSMKLEDQGVTTREHQRAIDRLVARLMAGSPRKLWE